MCACLVRRRKGKRTPTSKSYYIYYKIIISCNFEKLTYYTYTHVIRFDKIMNVKQVLFAKLFHILDDQKLCVSLDSLIKLIDVFCDCSALLQLEKDVCTNSTNSAFL